MSEIKWRIAVIAILPILSSFTIFYKIVLGDQILHILPRRYERVYLPLNKVANTPFYI